MHYIFPMNRRNPSDCAMGWLLTSSDRTVADIASRGFADASHLNREFKKSFGVKPVAYRETQNQEETGLTQPCP